MAAALSDVAPDAPLPVEHWHPSHCGAMDLVIRADGTWVHEGTPITRPRLVRLFSRVLRKDSDGYVLVTPAEKISIVVEDVPFVIVDTDWRDGVLTVQTNVGDRVAVGDAHPIHLRKGPGDVMLPYVTIRGALDARFGRAAYYRLLEEAELSDSGHLMVVSGDHRFDLGTVE